MDEEFVVECPEYYGVIQNMTKSELIKDMQKFCGSSFITRKKLTEYMGLKTPSSVGKYLYGLPRIGKSYFIPDVAEALMREVTYM